MKLLLLVSAVVLCTSCYTYVTRPFAEAPAGARVRIDLNAPGARDVEKIIGAGALSLEGLVAHSDSLFVDLALNHLTRSSGVEEDWPGSVVRIAGQGITNLRVAKLSKSKSLLTAGGLAVAVGALARGLGGGSAEGSRQPAGGTGK